MRHNKKDMKQIIVEKYESSILEPKGFPFWYLFGNWEGRWVYHPQIIVRNRKYYMFYSGKAGYSGFQMRHDIGIAISGDLRGWKRFEKNPVLSPNADSSRWDSDLVAHSYIIKKNNVYYMFYDGSPKGKWLEGIGLATSKDLINWRKKGKSAVLKSGSFWWEKNHVSRCCVVPGQKGYFYMYYAGHDGICERIGIARSKNLLSWEKFIKEPVLDLGQKGSWDERHISDPRVIKAGNYYLMFYTGYNRGFKGSIGLAYSKDMITWKRYSDPVLSYGKKGDWDQDEAGRADILSVDGQYYIFYSGRKGMFFRIGYAKLNMRLLLKNIDKLEKQ